MATHTIGSLGGELTKSHATLATDTSFPSRIPTVTEPTGDGVVNVARGGSEGCNGFFLMVYGTGADNDTLDLRVWAWNSVPATTTKAKEWFPALLAQFACTLSACVGVAGAVLLNTERICDTITLTTGNANVSNEIISPTGDLAAHILMDVKGAEKVEFTFDLGAGTGAGVLFGRR